MNPVLVNAVTRLSRADLKAVLERYDVGEPLDFWPAAHGIENSNYFVRASTEGKAREWVLTIIEQPPNSGAPFAQLLDRCFAAGLPVAPVRRNAAGNLLDALGGKPLLLSPRLPGSHPQTPSTTQAATLGAIIAKLHLTLRNPGFATPKHPRDESWLAQMAAAVDGHLAADDARLLECALHRVTSLLRRDDLASLPTGIIHGDLFRDNVLFDDDRLTGLLDFHHASEGWLIYDLAVAANDWCSDHEGSLKEGHANALLAAYHEHRPLTQAEVERLPDFMVYGALAFWLSRLSAMAQAQAGEAVRTKNPEEFQRITAHRLSGKFRPKLQL